MDLNKCCGKSPTLQDCADGGNYMAELINRFLFRYLPRAFGVGGTPVNITRGSKFICQTGMGWLMTVLSTGLTNRFGNVPETQDFILPTAVINLNNMAENTIQGAPVLGQGATMYYWEYVFDVPETVSALTLNVQESIQTDDSTAANPQVDLVNVQVKNRCNKGERVSQEAVILEALDKGNSNNTVAMAKDYGNVQQTQALFVPQGDNRIRTTTVTGTIGTGLGLTGGSVLSEGMLDLLMNVDKIWIEATFAAVMQGIGEKRKEWQAQVNNIGASQDTLKNDIQSLRNQVNANVQQVQTQALMELNRRQSVAPNGVVLPAQPGQTGASAYTQAAPNPNVSSLSLLTDDQLRYAAATGQVVR